MEENLASRLKELESLSFRSSGEAKQFLRSLKRNEPEVYYLLINYYEESRKPQEVDGYLVGKRVWNVMITLEGLRLYSNQKTIWEPYKELEAACSSGRIHAAPTEGCDCGIYAVKTDTKHWFSTGVSGTVALWGRFIEGDKEVYKAQFAYPQSFESVFCSFCSQSVSTASSVAYVHYSSSIECISFICKMHLRAKGPLLNLYVPASYIVDELRKEYGLEQPLDTVETFVESLNLDGF